MICRNSHKPPARDVLIPLLLFVATAPVATAQPPTGYYNTVDTTSAATLRVTLHEVIDDHMRTTNERIYAAGEGLDMDVRCAGCRVSQRIHHDDRPRRLLQPVIVCVRR